MNIKEEPELSLDCFEEKYVREVATPLSLTQPLAQPEDDEDDRPISSLIGYSSTRTPSSLAPVDEDTGGDSDLENSHNGYETDGETDPAAALVETGMLIEID